MDTRFDMSLEHAIDAIASWEYKDDVLQIYLYGSCARQEQKRTSDVDLYLIVEKDLPPKAVRDLKTARVPADWKLPDVDVKVDFGREAFLQNDLFHNNVRKDGVLLWERK